MTFLAEYLGSKVLDIAWDEAKRRIMGRRLEIARRLLIEELSRGNASLAHVEDVDEAAAMGFEYAEQALRGTARRNLRMLAQILAGAVVTPPVYADEFLRWSRVIADLTREEIIVMATLHKVHNMPAMTVGNNKQWNEIDAQMLLDLQGQGVVATKLELDSILGALQRTGLVNYHAGGYGGAWYQPTPRLDAVLQLIRMEVVLAEPDR